MFESLRKKFASLIGLEKKSKKGKKKAKKESKKKTPKTKQSKTKKTRLKKTEIKEEVASSIEESHSIEPIEEPIQEKEGNLEEVKKESEGFFSKLIRKISTSKLTEEDFNELFLEFEIILLENNVALGVVDKIKESLSKDLVGIEVKKDNAQKTVIDSLKKSILDILIEPSDVLKSISKKLSSPYVILFFGINGSGKTTSVAKFAHLLKKNNISCVLAAADTFRAASIEQLQTHAQRLGVPVIAHEYGSDPASVAFDAIQYAKKNNIKAVLIDTAGRMYTKSNLLKEMEKIVRVSKPDLKIFVGESITGNDATEQAKTFNETAGIDGIILSKADVDEKAGAILSVSYVTQKPIYFLGTGQDYKDLTEFKKKDVLKHLGLE